MQGYIDVESMVIGFTREYYRYCVDDKNRLEVYLDYRDHLPLEIIREVLESDLPYESLDKLLDDGLLDAWAYEGDFWKRLEAFCLDNGIDIDDASWIVLENFFWAYPSSYSNPEIPVTIAIDSDDVYHNQLNWIGDDADIRDSQLGWLARQQKELCKLRQAIKEERSGKDASERSAFVSSCIDELYNNASEMSSLTFFCRMPLSDAIALKEGNFKELVLPAGVEAGLTDMFNGGGSLLELEISRPVVIPAGMSLRVMCDDGRNPYLPASVYGMSANRRMVEAKISA